MTAAQDTSTGSERTAARTGDDERDERREGDTNSGGSSMKGKFAEVVGELQEVGSGLVVGAAAYKEGAGITPNPYFQYGTVETGGYGGPPNIGAVSHVFAQARRDALIFAKAVVDDTTGNQASYGQGVGTGLAPELVTRTPLTGQAARDFEKANVQAAADYQTAHPVMLHGLDESIIAAGQEGDEYGNPTDSGDSATSGGSSRPNTEAGDGGADAYDDNSDNAEQSSRRQARQGNRSDSGESSTPSGPSQPRQKVDPTRQSS